MPKMPTSSQLSLRLTWGSYRRLLKRRISAWDRTPTKHRVQMDSCPMSLDMVQQHCRHTFTVSCSRPFFQPLNLVDTRADSSSPFGNNKGLRTKLTPTVVFSSVRPTARYTMPGCDVGCCLPCSIDEPLASLEDFLLNRQFPESSSFDCMGDSVEPTRSLRQWSLWIYELPSITSCVNSFSMMILPWVSKNYANDFDLKTLADELRTATQQTPEDIPLALRRCLADAHRNTWFQLQQHGAMATETRRGTWPGSPLADIGFNLLMANLVQQLHEQLSQCAA